MKVMDSTTIRLFGLLKASAGVARSRYRGASGNAVAALAGFGAPAVVTGADTDRAHWFGWRGQALHSLEGLSSAGLLAGGPYFFTPTTMDETSVSIPAWAARTAVRALFSYKRLIGLGADLHGDVADTGLLQEIDAAITAVMQPSRKAQTAPSARRQTPEQA